MAYFSQNGTFFQEWHIYPRIAHSSQYEIYPKNPYFRHHEQNTVQGSVS